MRISRSLDFDYFMKSLLKVLFFCYIASSVDIIAQPVMKVENYMKQATTHAQQGAASYGKYLFHFTSGTICNIYDLDQKVHLGEMQYEMSALKHCDTACFGAYKVDPKDEFPVIYLSGSQVDKLDSNGLIWVYRILHNGENWNLKLHQIIKTPLVSDVGICPDALLDNYDGCMWIMGWKTNHAKLQGNGSGAYLNFVKFKTPALEDGILDIKGIRNVVLSMADCITSFVVNNAHAIQQGICIRNHIVYIPYGVSTLGYQGIDVVNLDEGRVVRNIDLMGSSVVEPEAVFFYRGEMFIADQGTTIKRVVNYKEYE